MTIRNVGKNATYPTIAAADAAAEEGDIIRMAAGYTYERAVLTVENLTVTGGAALLRIDLELGAGVNNVTVDGPASIWVEDNALSNVITGNRAGNVVHVSGGADVVHGGDGSDALYVDYFGSTSVVATAGSVTDNAGNSVTYDSVEYFVISTGSGDNSLTADDSNYRLLSGGGNDTIVVGDGRNYVEAGLGNDTVTTGDGNNWVIVETWYADDWGDDTVTTGDGNDVVESGSGDDTLKTGGGRDDVDILGGIDTVDMGDGRDLLTIGYARLRTDVTFSISAGSLAEGYSGLMTDATGNNSVSFTGVEHFIIIGGKADDDLRLGAGADTVWGEAGDDLLHGGAGHDRVYGDNNRDTLLGGRGEDYLDGGGGNDALIGGRDEDVLYGSVGDDTLIGGRGHDVLEGGVGADVLTGGLGADVFLFWDFASSPRASDLIDDLKAVDTIDLSRIDADLTANGDQAFVLVNRFSGTAGEATLRYNVAANVSRLALDTDGDGAADIAIIASGNHRGFDNFVL
jgi:Ca2+-binding RTX toxin-like protein